LMAASISSGAICEMISSSWRRSPHCSFQTAIFWMLKFESRIWSIYKFLDLSFQNPNPKKESHQEGNLNT
jgi:hypothetical protein